MKLYDYLIRRLDVLVVFTIVLIPILNNSIALWDGAVINYSFDISDPEMLIYLYEPTGSILASCLHLFIYYTSSYIGGESKFYYSFLISLLSILLYFEFVKIFSLSKELNKSERLIISICFSALPFWSSFLSDVYINYLFFTYCTFVSVNFLLKEKYVLAFIIGLISLTLKTNIYLHPLVFLFSTAIFFKNNDQEASGKIKKILLFYMLMVFLFIIQSIYFVPYGKYENYNAVEITKFIDFFFDYKVLLKLSFLFPLLLISFFSKDRVLYFTFIILSIGLVGIFYLTNKFSFLSIFHWSSFQKVHPYILRYDIGFYFFIFFLFSFLFFSIRLKYLKIIAFVLYMSFFLPQKYFADLKMSGMISDIKSVYAYFEKSDDLVGKEGLIKTKIEGTTVANYHFYKIFGDTKKISFASKDSASEWEYCSRKHLLIYRKLGVCNEFQEWGTIYSPKIDYSKYSVLDLWFR
ncbi:hypothetical protein [Aliivibrio wodanis]|uniref:hypothetical protein n=1 Tax=Aliivibrio wodanis TaxID=80852 RepID=UPI00406D4841